MLQTIISELGKIWDKQKSNDAKELLQAWEAAQTVPGHDAKQIRKDTCGAWIVYEEFGLTNSKNAWQIDHYTEKNAEGSVSRMRALHIKNKIRRDMMLKQNQKDDVELNFCAITAKD